MTRADVLAVVEARVSVTTDSTVAMETRGVAVSRTASGPVFRARERTWTPFEATASTSTAQNKEARAAA
ncbi:hypothetical protein BKA66DRAFT_476827 [Pyrenochaeta sp. MPI-SDFR-AT-0127]|nr:hypothetical protein BKA66DRAFT_476827 [Pyrenochaeta sp. MPI-SDFR-AT-0127]